MLSNKMLKSQQSFVHSLEIYWFDYLQKEIFLFLFFLHGIW